MFPVAMETIKTNRDSTISNLRFVCVFAMMTAHAFGSDDLVVADQGLPYLTTGSLVSPIILVLYDGFSRISAPLLGFLAGYFFAANVLARSYIQVFWVRVRTLIIPVLTWNAIFAALQLTAAYSLSNTEFVDRFWNSLNVDSFLGWSKWPLNFPLHYLVDLFKCILIAPVGIWILNRLGWRIFLVVITATCLFLIASDLNPPEPGFNTNSVLPRSDLFLFFFVGLLVRHSREGKISDVLDRLSGSQNNFVLGVIFLVCATHWRWVVLSDGDLAVWAGALGLFATRVTGSLLILSALTWFRSLAARGLAISEKFTFRLFTTHAITFFFAKHSIKYFFGEQFYRQNLEIAFFVVPFIALLVAYALYRFEESARKTYLRILSPAPVHTRTPQP